MTVRHNGMSRGRPKRTVKTAMILSRLVRECEIALAASGFESLVRRLSDDALRETSKDSSLPGEVRTAAEDESFLRIMDDDTWDYHDLVQSLSIQELEALAQDSTVRGELSASAMREKSVRHLRNAIMPGPGGYSVVGILQQRDLFDSVLAEVETEMEVYENVLSIMSDAEFEELGLLHDTPPLLRAALGNEALTREEMHRRDDWEDWYLNWGQLGL